MISFKSLLPILRSRRTVLIAMGIGLACIGLATSFNPPYKLLYNPSESAPKGWYLLRAGKPPRIGAYVLASLPTTAATLASRRGYLPAGVPILKHVAALSGQRICRERDMITIDGVLVAHALAKDGADRPMPQIDGCLTLGPDGVFLLNRDNPFSFDGRYFGPISRRFILGEAIPLWTH